MVTLYTVCLLAGLLFAVISFLFSGGYDATVDTGVDVGVHADVGGDFGHDIAGGDAGVGEVHFPLFSPIVIASFVTAFGGGGLVGLRLFPVRWLSLVTAVGAGIGVGLVAGLIVYKIYKAAAANQVTQARELVGHLAEVTEPIAANGVGAITFSGKGGRISGPARSEENKDIKRHAMVTITRVVGGLYYVREHVDEKLRDVQEAAEEGEKGSEKG
ncbi:MAG: hypothetical protein D6806_06525 [Deltaproteobacteria bacterium]|nr:MAG: hypothetical protein D6806_06525 [Deltaproteobacteria bacterium]